MGLAEDFAAVEIPVQKPIEITIGTGRGKPDLPKEYKPLYEEFERALAELNPSAAAPEPAKPYDVPGPVGLLMHAGQGATFGFGDEIAGSAGFDTNRYRATLDAIRQKYPLAAPAAQLAGGAVVPLGVGKYALGAKSWSPFATSLAGAGAAGAAYGAGEATNPEDRAHDAAVNGALSIPLGIGVMGTTAGGSTILGALRNQATRVPGIPGVPSMTEDLAIRQVARALERDRINARDIGITANRLGDEARIVDTGERNAANLLDVNASMPGETSTALDKAIRERIAGAPQRFDTIVELANNGRGRLASNMETWKAIRQADSAPLYAKFTANPIVADADLEKLVGIAERTGHFKTARDIAEYNQSPFTLSEPPVIQNGQRIFSPHDLNHLKQSLDVAYEQAEARGNKTLAMHIADFKTKFVDAVDRQSGGLYRPALDAFSGPSALMGAAEKGRKAIFQDEHSILTMTGGMNNSEKEAFRIGAAEALRTKFGAPAGQREYMNVWQNRNNQEKLQAIFGDDQKYRQALDFLSAQDRLSRMNRLGQGSQTAPRQFAGDDQAATVASDALELADKAKTGGMISKLVKGLVNMSAGIQTPEPVRNEIGRILLSRDFGNYVGKLTSAQELMRQKAMAAALRDSSVAGQALPTYLNTTKH